MLKIHTLKALPATTSEDPKMNVHAYLNTMSDIDKEIFFYVLSLFNNNSIDTLRNSGIYMAKCKTLYL